MSPIEPEPTNASASFLSEQWRAASHASVWRSPGDWHGPAVESMVHAVVDGTDPEAAAGLLGADRGQRGVGIAEGLDDLSVLFGVATAEEPPYAVTRSFAKEWVEVATEALQNKGSIDALTGLATLDYLEVRLRELYAEGPSVGAERGVIVVDAGMGRVPGWRRIMRGSLVARILSSVFDHGQTLAVLPSGTFVVIARRDDQWDESVARLRVNLSRDGLAEASTEEPAVTVRVEALPATVTEATALFARL